MWLLYHSVLCIIHLIHSQSPKCLRLYCVGLIIATENLFCLIFQPLLPHHLYRASLFTKANSVSYPKSSVLLISISLVKQDDSLQAGSSQVWNRMRRRCKSFLPKFLVFSSIFFEIAEGAKVLSSTQAAANIEQTFDNFLIIFLNIFIRPKCAIR